MNTEINWTLFYPGQTLGKVALGEDALYALGVSGGISFLRKHELGNGGILWERAFPAAEPMGLVAYTSGGVYLAGVTGGSLLLKKYDPLGNLLWNSMVNGVGAPSGLAVSAEILAVTAGNDVVWLAPWNGAFLTSRGFGPAGSSTRGVALAGSGVLVFGNSGTQGATLQVYSQSGVAGPRQTVGGNAVDIASAPHGVYGLVSGPENVCPPPTPMFPSPYGCAKVHKVARFTSDGTLTWITVKNPELPWQQEPAVVATDSAGVYAGGSAYYFPPPYHVVAGYARFAFALDSYGRVTGLSGETYPWWVTSNGLAAGGGFLYATANTISGQPLGFLIKYAR